jgi:hypothetical protein
MISVILICFAAFFNAIMDRVGDEVAFNASIFSKLNPKFWSKDISWKYAKKVFGWKFDAWHVAKSLMVCTVILGYFYHTPIVKFDWASIRIGNLIFPWIDYILLGFTWNGVFNIFYKHLLKKR